MSEPPVIDPVNADKVVCPIDDIGLFVADVESLGGIVEVTSFVVDGGVPNVVGDGLELVGGFCNVEGAVDC